MQNKNTRRTLYLGYGACALACALWGTGFFFGRLALNEMSVEHMVLYRFGFACLVMLPLALYNLRSIRLDRASLRTLLISAALGIPLQFLVQFHGLARTTVSHASLMVGAFPVMLAAAATFFGREKLDRFGWTATWVSTLGAALVALGGRHGGSSHGQPTMTGDLLVIASLFTALFWVLMSKKLMERHPPVVISALTIISGSAMLAVWVLGPWLLSLVVPALQPVAAPPIARLTWVAWSALAASGILCTATTTFLWNWGIHHVPASRAGIFINLEPALGSLLGVTLLGEQLGPQAWLGGGLILVAAIALTARSQTPDPEIILE